VRLTVDGLQERELLQELIAFIKQEAAIKQIVAQIVVPKKGPGIAIELRMPIPDVVELTWRDYRIRATGFEGELFIVCKKLTDDHDYPKDPAEPTPPSRNRQ